MRTQYRNPLTVLLTLVALAGASACDVDKVEDGEAPEVDIDPGKAPEYEVEGPEVDVKTEKKQVQVPDVDVETETETVTVPDVDVDVPEDDEEVQE